MLLRPVSPGVQPVSSAEMQESIPTEVDQNPGFATHSLCYPGQSVHPVQASGPLLGKSAER